MTESSDESWSDDSCDDKDTFYDTFCNFLDHYNPTMQLNYSFIQSYIDVFVEILNPFLMVEDFSIQTTETDIHIDNTFRLLHVSCSQFIDLFNFAEFFQSRYFYLLEFNGYFLNSDVYISISNTTDQCIFLFIVGPPNIVNYCKIFESDQDARRLCVNFVPCLKLILKHINVYKIAIDLYKLNTLSLEMPRPLHKLCRDFLTLQEIIIPLEIQPILDMKLMYTHFIHCYNPQSICDFCEYTFERSQMKQQLSLDKKWYDLYYKNYCVF